MVETRTSSSLVVDFEARASRSEVNEAIEEVDGEVVESLPELGRVKVVEVEPGTVDDAVAELDDEPIVEIVEPDLPRVPLAVIPSDPYFGKQWALHNDSQTHPIADPIGDFRSTEGKADADVDAPFAWDIEDGSSNETIIAVLDIGFDIAHPDIANNRWQNPGEVAGDEEDNDGNGFVDDVRGWDFDEDDADPNDPANTRDKGHGTHVAALAAGVWNNSGIAGICPECKILPLRFGLSLGQELEAIDYLIATLDAHPDLRIPVLNVSFGGVVWSRLERDAFERLGDRGVLTVAAAGNGGLDNDMLDYVDYNNDLVPDDFSPVYPASYQLPHVLSVAASNDRDQLGYDTGCDRRAPRYLCRFSNWGRESVDLAAPGTDMKSAYVSNGSGPRYRTWNGTSMAAPLVAGIAGLVAAEHPSFSALDLKNVVMNSVDKPKSLKKVWRRRAADRGSFMRTNGRVNALSAVSSTNIGDATAIHDGMIAGARPIGEARRGRLAWPGDVNDVHSRALTRGVEYTVTLRASRRGRDLDLVVYKPGTQDVWQLEEGCFGAASRCSAVTPFGGIHRDGKPERLEFTAPSNGTFYFHASTYFDDTRYRLTIRRGK